MSKNKTELEKIGYIKTLPKDADINDYESITIKDKKGNQRVLYRFLRDNEDIDDITNFHKSWNVFNSYLNH